MYRGTTGKEHLGEPRSALEDPCQSGLRFPVGTPVRCFVGDNNWLGGTVVAQNYRETGWPEDRPSAPYTLPGRTQWASACQPQATVCNHGSAQANRRPATGHGPCVAGLGRALLPDPARAPGAGVGLGSAAV
eukprot:scaffold91117_cov63-Phaeocystis_antarctica.AAC.2